MARRAPTRRTSPYRVYVRDGRDQLFALDELARSSASTTSRFLNGTHSIRRSGRPCAVWSAIGESTIVHGHEYRPTCWRCCWPAERIAPIATAHGWTGHSPRERYLYYPGDRWLLRRFHWSSPSRSRSAVPDRRRCRALPVVTVLNGIDPSVFHRDAGNGWQCEPPSAFPPPRPCSARSGAGPQKRYDLLIEAFLEVRRHAADAWLLIAGDGSEQAALAALVHRHGLESRCLLLGHRTDIKDVLRALDVFVQSSDYEGTPNVVLEAMAMETPVVATTAGGTEQLIDDGVHGLLVPPGRSEPIAAAIIRALDDPDGRQARACAARRRIETELSFDIRMSTVERLYGGLLKNAP